MVRRRCPDGQATPPFHAAPYASDLCAHRARGQRVLHAPSAFLQDHGTFAWRNQFGTFQVKNEQNKTETSPKFQKTKTTKTEQKTTDKLPTAGHRVVHFRALAYALTIIGVAAACGLSVCPPWSSRSIRTAVCVVPLLAVFGTRLAVSRRTHLHASAFHTLGYACAH